MEAVDHPTALPGCCILCPGSVRDRYVDTGLQMDYYGAVYLCAECVTSMGRLIGMISEDQASILIQNNSDLARQNYELQTKLTALEVGLNGLVDAGYINPSVLGRNRGVHCYSEEHPGLLPSSTGSGEEGSSGAEGNMDSGTGAPDESSDDQGVGVVRSDADDDADGRYTITI